MCGVFIPTDSAVLMTLPYRDVEGIVADLRPPLMLFLCGRPVSAAAAAVAFAVPSAAVTSINDRKILSLLWIIAANLFSMLEYLACITTQ